MKRNVNNLEGPVFPSVEACAREIGVSPRHLRTQIKGGHFPHVRMGKRIIIPRKAVMDYLNGTAERKVVA
jgi:excisionase family DNA binding protein